MKGYYLLLIVVLGIFVLLSEKGEARRRRRDTSRSGMNCDYNRFDSLPLQRIIRQVADSKDSDEEDGDALPPINPTVVTTVKPTVTNKSTNLTETTKSTNLTVNTKPTSPNATIQSTNTSVLPTTPSGEAVPRAPPTRPPPPPPTVAPAAVQGELYLPPGYNRLEIPKLKIGRSLIAVPVVVYLNIRSIQDYDELKEHVTLELDLIVEWFDGHLFDITKVDPRVAPIQVTLNPVFLKKIWTPDIYMDNLIDVKQPKFMIEPLTLKFSPNTGFISYTARMAVEGNCDMYFHYYPADTQTCEFQLKSFSFYSNDLELDWLLHGVYLQDPSEPNFDIQVSSIEKIKTIQPYNNPRNQTHDTLVFTILARRRLSFHLVQTYLPSIFFIIITWLCFLIPSKFIEARIGISMTTLLTLTAMFASVRESTPIVSYVKAIDLWMVFCIFFVFLTLLEFSILIWMRAIREDAEKDNTIEDKNGEDIATRRKNLSESLSQHSTSSSTLRAHGVFTEIVEKYAFVIFSIIFVVFNIIYWTWLLQAAKYFDWDVNATHTSIGEDD